MARFNKALAQLMQREGTEVSPELASQPQTVIAELHQRVSGEEYSLLSPFADALLRNGRLLESVLSTSDIASLTLGAFRFLCDRHTAPLGLRAFTPSAAEDGWQCDQLVLEVAADSRPNLIESICEVVEQSTAQIEVMLSAIVQVERDEKGLALAVSAGGGSSDECLVHLHLSGVGNPVPLEAAVRRQLENIAQDQREAQSLEVQAAEAISHLSGGSDDDRELASLLEWLIDGRMTLAGYQEVGPPEAPGTRSLGIYLNPCDGIDQAWSENPEDGLFLVKTRVPQPSHPSRFLDELRFRPAAPAATRPTAYRIAGVFRPQAFREPTSAIPGARTVCNEVLLGLAESTPPIDGNIARSIFDQLPVDLVLSASPDDIRRLLIEIHGANAAPGFRSHLTPVNSGNFCFLTLSVPRQDVTRPDLDRVGAVIGQRFAPVLSAYMKSDDLAVARLHFSLACRSDKVRPEALDDLNAHVRELLSNWRKATVDGTTVSKPTQPKTPEVAPLPTPTDDPGLHPRPKEGSIEIAPSGSDGRSFRITWDPSRRDPLHEILRLLDRLGLRVSAHTTAGPTHEITVELRGARAVSAADLRSALDSARDAPIDDFAELWQAVQNPHQLQILRAYAALAGINGIADVGTIAHALTSAPEAAALLAETFEIKFDPRRPLSSPAQRSREVDTRLSEYRAQIASVAGRRARAILEALADCLETTVRTSLYASEHESPCPPLALKTQPAGAGASFEIFVFAEDFEALVLRQDRVSRARLRISDSAEDLRQDAREDLATQALRSGSISTTAAAAVLAIKSANTAMIDQSFRDLLTTTLAVFDNIVGGEAKAANGVVVFDEPDPFFSLMLDERPTGWADIAAAVIAESGFWMGDSCVTRYDARVAAEGAWAATQPLLAKSPEGSPPETIAFGSPRTLHLPQAIRFVAAFDSEEIFIDPSPDPKKSHEALVGLSRRAQATWADFPSEMRSRGSAVFARTANKIELSEEAAELFGFEDHSTNPRDLIAAILAHRADLLWLQSERIGTKAHTEPALTSKTLGARTIVELDRDHIAAAMRSELELAGHTIQTAASNGLAADLVADRVSNTDLALVNLQSEQAFVYTPELAADLRRSAIDLPARQTFATTLDQLRSREDWNSFATCLRRSAATDPIAPTDDADTNFKHTGASVPSAKASGLPPLSDLIERQSIYPGLTRSEIITLRSIVATRIKTQLQTSSMCEDPYLSAWIDEYFPEMIPEKFPELIDRHPLRHEIAAVAVCERTLEVMGVAFSADLAEAHGASELDVVKAWCAAFIFGGAQEVWTEIEEAAASLPERAHQLYRLELAEALKLATRRLLDMQSSELSLEKIIDRFGGAAGELLRAWPEILPEPMKSAHEAAVEKRARNGLARTVADHLERISHLAEIVDIGDLAIQINSPRNSVAAVFLALEALLHFRDTHVWLSSIKDLDRRWGDRAAVHLSGRLTSVRRALTADILSNAAGRNPIERYLDAHGHELSKVQSMQGEIHSESRPSIAALEVLIANLEQLISPHRRRSWQS